MNPVVHFEMPATDRNRMSDFYKNTFGDVMSGKWERLDGSDWVHWMDIKLTKIN